MPKLRKLRDKLRDGLRHNSVTTPCIFVKFLSTYFPYLFHLLFHLGYHWYHYPFVPYALLHFLFHISMVSSLIRTRP
ncbi:hypothetical protein F5887DRAFT_967889 [Amanita rubescens]|nr:hypothetical protein F5887DRAFT_1010738 [Amanita rubescens]KAF8345060.1 hypothetical protein F5887DRAFT_967889 [Amanita rubescens]